MAEKDGVVQPFALAEQKVFEKEWLQNPAWETGRRCQVVEWFFPECWAYEIAFDSHDLAQVPYLHFHFEFGPYLRA